MKANSIAPVTPMSYIKSKRSGITQKEWEALSEDDQDQLRTWARQEMLALGLAVYP